MLNRRRFFRYTLLGAGALTIGYTGYTAVAGFKKAVTNILTADLKGLKTNDADIEAYATTLAQNNILYFSDAMIKLICLYTSNPFKSLPLPFKKTYNRGRAEIVGNFLLSTNFFTNKMDEQQEIRYSGIIYGPYRRPCTNPFSGLYYHS